MAAPSPSVWKRKEPSQPRAKHTVACLLEAATQILAREGEAGLTTNRVAQRAGCSIGTLYQYFRNREAIQMAIFLRESEAVSLSIRHALGEVNPAGDAAMVRHVVGILITAFKARWPARRMYAAMMAQAASLDGPETPIGIVARSVLEARSRSDYGRRHPLNESEVFVLTRAIRGILQGALSEDTSHVGEHEFEEAMVRLITGFLRPACGH